MLFIVGNISIGSSSFVRRTGGIGCLQPYMSFKHYYTGVRGGWGKENRARGHGSVDVRAQVITAPDMFVNNHYVELYTYARVKQT